MYITCAAADFDKMMDYVQPEYRFICDYYNDDLEIEFEYEDYIKAEKWVYMNYERHIYGSYNGFVQCIVSVTYDEESGFFWYSDVEKKEVCGFSSSEEAVEAAEAYVDSLGK